MRYVADDVVVDRIPEVRMSQRVVCVNVVHDPNYLLVHTKVVSNHNVPVEPSLESFHCEFVLLFSIWSTSSPEGACNPRGPNIWCGDWMLGA